MPKITRRQFLAGTVATLATGISTAAYISGPDLGAIEIVPIRLSLPELDPIFNGYRLVQISDIHIGTAIKRLELLNIVSLVNQQKPDLVAITGDFVSHHPHRYADDLITPLKQLEATDGVVGVLGNHDHWTSPYEVRNILGKSGIIELRNDVYTIERGSAVLNMAGVDDVWVEEHRLDLVLKRLPQTGPAILLAHEPDFADTTAATERFAVQLSGHSHGGQIILPFVGPLVLPTLAQKYRLGRYQVGNMVQYTNRGIGTTRIQVRVNCRPEITVFVLEQA